MHIVYYYTRCVTRIHLRDSQCTTTVAKYDLLKCTNHEIVCCWFLFSKKKIEGKPISVMHVRMWYSTLKCCFHQLRMNTYEPNKLFALELDDFSKINNKSTLKVTSVLTKSDGNVFSLIFRKSFAIKKLLVVFLWLTFFSLRCCSKLNYYQFLCQLPTLSAQHWKLFNLLYEACFLRLRCKFNGSQLESCLSPILLLIFCDAYIKRSFYLFFFF